MTDYDDPRAYGEQPRLTDADLPKHSNAFEKCAGCGLLRSVYLDGTGVWSTCQNCGTPWPKHNATPPPPADVVPVPREVLAALVAGCVIQRDNGDYVWSECNCCYSSRPRDGRYLVHDDDCAVPRAGALLARDEPRGE